MKEAKTVFSDDEKLVRRASIYLCHKYSGMKLRETGECFNVRDTAISEASRRFARELERDGKLRDMIAGIIEKLKKCRM